MVAIPSNQVTFSDATLIELLKKELSRVAIPSNQVTFSDKELSRMEPSSLNSRNPF